MSRAYVHYQDERGLVEVSDAQFGPGRDLLNQQGSPTTPEHAEQLPASYRLSDKPLPYRPDRDSLFQERWPTTHLYDQNSPGIMGKMADLFSRGWEDYWDFCCAMAVLRVPLCASYGAALAKVGPRTILELGTDGDAAHSTAVFLHWSARMGEGCEVDSVDRHPLSSTWPRFKDHPRWTFYQGDDLALSPHLRLWYDLIFIDTIHTYEHTLRELRHYSARTDALLMDDAGMPEIRKAIDDFKGECPEWVETTYWCGGIVLLERRPRA